MVNSFHPSMPYHGNTLGLAGCNPGRQVTKQMLERILTSNEMKDKGKELPLTLLAALYQSLLYIPSSAVTSADKILSYQISNRFL